VFWLVVGCGGSGETGPSEIVVISDLQARVQQRLVADRPFNLDVSFAASDPKRLIGGQVHLRRLRTAQDTCATRGGSPVIASTSIDAADVSGNRVQVGFIGAELPAGRSRLCVLATLPGGLAQRPQGTKAAETPTVQTNELELTLDAASGGPTLPGAPPSQSTGGGPRPPPPTVTITASDASAAESPLDAGTFQVSRTGSTAAPLTVFFGVGGSATSGSDYGLRPNRDQHRHPGRLEHRRYHRGPDQRLRWR
jgi:hypothetical protein